MPKGDEFDINTDQRLNDIVEQIGLALSEDELLAAKAIFLRGYTWGLKDARGIMEGKE